MSVPVFIVQFYFLFTRCIPPVYIIQLLVPVTDGILPVCIMQVLLLVSDCKLCLPIQNFLQSWEISAQLRLYFLVKHKYVFLWWDLVPTSPWGKLNPVPTAVLIVTMIPNRTHSVLGHRFPWLYISYINCFESPLFQRIIIESGISPW